MHVPKFQMFLYGMLFGITKILLMIIIRLEDGRSQVLSRLDMVIYAQLKLIMIFIDMDNILFLVSLSSNKQKN